jgi:anti-sigma B factor antagonist
MADHVEVHKLSNTSGEVLVLRLLDKKYMDPIVIRDTAAAIAAQVDEGHTKLVVAFTGVQMVVSSFLNSLIKLKQKLDSKSGSLRLCNLSPPVQDAFKATGLERVFVIKETEKEALADF